MHFQEFSRNGTHKRSLPQRKRDPKLTVERLVKAIPAIGDITQRQLAAKVNCTPHLTSRVADEAIAQGLIEVFCVFGKEKTFRRIG